MGELISFWEPEEIIPDEMEAVMGKDKDKDKKDKDEKKKDKKKKDKKKDKK